MSPKEENHPGGNPVGYARHYDEDRLWQKLRRMPRSSLALVLENTLLLYELLTDRDTPLWVRGTLVGVLGYLVWPWDLCPDFLPGAGLLDDAAMLALVMANVEGLVTDTIRERSRRRMASIMPTNTTGGEP